MKLPNTSSVLKVGHGRDFIVRHPPSKFSRRLIITAAHCLGEELPPAHAASSLEERIFTQLGNLTDKEPNVPGEILFVDPIRDIAVLGAPDGQAYPEGEDAYDGLTENAPILRVGRIHPRSKTGWILSLDGKWTPTPLQLFRDVWGQSLSTGPTEGGMSGSPILDNNGCAIAVVVIGSNETSGHGPQPILTDALPGWLLN